MDDYILEVADACTAETAIADRVKIMAYQWRAAKLLPKKYGEKVDLTTQGEKINSVDPLEAVARIKAILEKK